jgi:hypothetical protein
MEYLMVIGKMLQVLLETKVLLMQAVAEVLQDLILD